MAIVDKTLTHLCYGLSLYKDNNQLAKFLMWDIGKLQYYIDTAKLKTLIDDDLGLTQLGKTYARMYVENLLTSN